LEISKENTYSNIKEALKKIETSQRNSNSYAKDSWFILIQKCIIVAANSFNNQDDLETLKDLQNKYVIKEILERYIKN
jgi:hypothetical protein